MSRIVLFNKPFDVLSQFTGKGTEATPRATLSDFIDVPDVYPAGRLDRDSEGLMVLTDDGRLQARISNPRFKQTKTYLAQVEGIPSDEALNSLAKGVTLNDGPTRPAKVSRIPEPEFLWERNPPIRVRKSIPDSWISITITEGRNRQVRRMTAAIAHPTLRLIRYSVGRWTIDGLKPGEYSIAEASAKLGKRNSRSRKPRSR